MARRRKKPVDESDLVQRDGALVLTFVNTGSRRRRRLRDYADLLTWANQNGALDGAEVSRLHELSARREEDVAAVFSAAEAMHSALSRIANAAADHQAPPVDSVNVLNGLLIKVAPRRILIPHGSGLRWGWPPDSERDLFRPLWALAQSASDLLTSDNWGRVKRCAASDCDVLFLVKKVAGMPRKWCSVRTCSAPAQSRNYYRRVVKPMREEINRELNQES